MTRQITSGQEVRVLPVVLAKDPAGHCQQSVSDGSVAPTLEAHGKVSSTVWSLALALERNYHSPAYVSSADKLALIPKRYQGR